MDESDSLTPIPAPDESLTEAFKQAEIVRARRLCNLLGLTCGPPSRQLEIARALRLHEAIHLDPALADIARRDQSAEIQQNTPTGTLQELTKSIVPALCTALGAWLGARLGRKVRIKVGDIEAEAHTQ